MTLNIIIQVEEAYENMELQVQQILKFNIFLIVWNL
jgi:hypothetical protein